MPSVSDWLSSASLSFSSNKDVIDDAIVVADAPDLGRGDTTTSHEHVIASKRVLGLVEVRAGLCAASGVLSLALLRDSSRICLTSSIEYLGSGGGICPAAALAFAASSAASFSSIIRFSSATCSNASLASAILPSFLVLLLFRCLAFFSACLRLLSSPSESESEEEVALEGWCLLCFLRLCLLSFRLWW